MPPARERVRVGLSVPAGLPMLLPREVGNYAQHVDAGAPGELLPSPASAVLTLPLDDTLLTLETQSSMLAVDLTLAAGESQSP